MRHLSPHPSTVLAALVALAGCAPAEKAAPLAAEIPLTVRLLCGDQPIAVGFAGEAARLQVGSESFALRQVRTASGARYEAAGDPTTSFWSKGPGGLLELRGRRYPECMPAGGAAPAFRARGNEPGWTLEIAGGRIVLVTDYGQRRIEEPTPAAVTAAGATRYPATGSAGLAVAIENRVCRDDMTGMPYPKSVQVEVEGRTLRGCGGEPAALLRGREWVVERIAGTPAVADPRPALSFGEDGRIAGQAPCNRFTADYTLTGEGLSIGPPAATRRLCPGPAMEAEAAFLEALAAVRRFDLGPDGALRLLGAGEEELIAAR